MLPPLYKFLNVEGAKLTFENGTFKHSKPSDFNDLEDLTIKSIFPEDIEIALRKITENFTDIIVRHLNDPPTCSLILRPKIALLQEAYKTNPNAAQIIKSEIGRDGIDPIWDIEHMRKFTDEFVHTINEFMQTYRIFCVTALLSSDAIWSEYAENHKGVAVRIEPSIGKDSKLQLFRQVNYFEERPCLYDDTISFIEDSMFGDQNARITLALEKIIYSKTLKWKHENEYRLAIPLREGEQPWNTKRYYPEEVTELYLGYNIEEADKSEIVKLAKSINPKISVFQSSVNVDGALSFKRE